MQKTTEQKAAGRPARLNYKMKTQLQLYALLAPVLILIFIFCYLPLYGLLIAFQEWYPGMPFLDFTGATKWVGLKHFISIFLAFDQKHTGAQRTEFGCSILDPHRVCAAHQ